jgi:hypothetical protein
MLSTCALCDANVILDEVMPTDDSRLIPELFLIWNLPETPSGTSPFIMLFHKLIT